jgi:prepilin-type N-terminal cleavage/methylation domain-containing protein
MNLKATLQGIPEAGQVTEPSPALAIARLQQVLWSWANRVRFGAGLGLLLRMKQLKAHRQSAGVTMLELLCVIALITILAGLLLGPVSQALRRARAMKWGYEAPALLESTVSQLRKHFQGKKDFPPVTLASLETGSLLEPSQLRFLKDRRVTFVPFAGADPDEQVVIEVRLGSGFLVEAGQLTATKGEITKPPG